MILTVDSDRSAYFVYWHYKRNLGHFKSALGDLVELFIVSENHLDREKPDDWVPLVLRNLPLHFDKIKLTRLLNGVTHRDFEELVMLNEKKHTLVFFDDIESAVEAMQVISNRMKDTHNFKVNLHPEFAKLSWRSLDPKVNPYANFYKYGNCNSFEGRRRYSYEEDR